MQNQIQHTAFDAPGGWQPTRAAAGDTIRVLVADARPLVRVALCDLIEGLQPLMVVAGEADTGGRAVEIARCVWPDVVLLGACADPEALPATVCALAALGSTRVLLLTGLHDGVDNESLLRAGAAGTVTAEEPTEAIVRAILAVRGTRQEASPAPQRHRPMARRAPEALTALTLRERQLIGVIVARPSAKYLAIADELGISEHTVHNHLSRIYQKLKVVNRSDLLAYAVGHGWAAAWGLPGG